MDHFYIFNTVPFKRMIVRQDSYKSVQKIVARIRSYLQSSQNHVKGW